MSPSESTFYLSVFVYSTPIVSFYLSLLPGHTARWCKMLFPFPHVLVLTSGDSSLLFCSCVAGFLPCFSYDRSICTLSLDSLFLTLEKFQPWDWFWYPLTCGPRGGVGVHMVQISRSKFLPWSGLNLGPLTWQSSTQSLDHRSPPSYNALDLYKSLFHFSGVTCVISKVPLRQCRRMEGGRST